MRPELEKEAELGITDPYRKHRKRPLDEHIADFEQHLKAKNNSPDHVKLVLSRLRRIVSEAEFRLMSDISASQVECFLAQQREKKMSIQTTNHYLRAIKQFTRWLVRDRRTPDNPLDHLETLNVQTDRRRLRRALTVEEFEKLIQTTETGPVVQKMCGTDRAILYIISAYTGYRRGEIASVTPASFDFESDPPTLTVEAGHSKRRRLDVIPLRADFAERIQKWLESKKGLDTGKPLFRVSKSRTAEMIKADLEQAGIPYVDVKGRYADFHALRHTFISNLGKAGVSPKTTQSLARHSDINLTMNVYSHLELQEQSEALKQLPPLPKSKTQKIIKKNGAQIGAQEMALNGSEVAGIGSEDGQDTKAVEAGEGNDGESITKEIDATYPFVASIGVGCQKRRGGDLNPRTGCPVSGFQDRCIRPLCHLSEGFIYRRWSSFRAKGYSFVYYALSSRVV